MPYGIKSRLNTQALTNLSGPGSQGIYEILGPEFHVFFIVSQYQDRIGRTFARHLDHLTIFYDPASGSYPNIAYQLNHLPRGRLPTIIRDQSSYITFGFRAKCRRNLFFEIFRIDHISIGPCLTGFQCVISSFIVSKIHVTSSLIIDIGYSLQILK